MVGHDGELLLRGSCWETRGLANAGLVCDHKRNMVTMAQGTLACGRVLTFR